MNINTLQTLPCTDQQTQIYNAGIQNKYLIAGGVAVAGLLSKGKV